MPRPTGSAMAAALLALVVTTGQAWAGGPGQEDLDRATEIRLNAKTLGDLAEVIRLVESALDKGLDEGDAQFARSLLAAVLIQRGSSLAGLAIATPPQNPDFADRRKAALADLEKGVQLSPQQPQALYLIARLNLLPGGEVKRADEALRQAIELSADQPPLRAEALILRAETQKDPQKRMADLDEAVRIAPDNANPVRVRGLFRADTGELEQSLVDLDKALQLDPKHMPTYEAKALVLARLKRFDEALVCLDKAQELRPDSIVPLLQKARIHGLQANLDAALHELSRAHEMQPESAAVLLLRAGVYRDKGEQEKALADVDAALKLRPQLPGGMRLRALLLADAGKRDEAIAELEKLRQSDPQDLLGLLQLGVLCAAEERHQQAVEAFSAVLTQRPDERLALRGRGDSLLNLGKHPQAIADYETLIKLQPKDASTLNNLAWVLATSPDDKLRDGKRAVALATEACELTEYKAAHILSTLAAAYAENGDFPAAIKWVEKGVEVAKEAEKEPLSKELESYRNRKPWRERLSAEKPQEPPTKKPEETHDEKPDEKH
jgi:tetratricopeptide (TPR) repeat protein